MKNILKFFDLTEADDKYCTDILHEKGKLIGRLVMINCMDLLTLKGWENEKCMHPDMMNIPDFRFKLPSYIIDNKLRGLGRALICLYNGFLEMPMLLIGATEEIIDKFVNDGKVKTRRIYEGEERGKD